MVLVLFSMVNGSPDYFTQCPFLADMNYFNNVGGNVLLGAQIFRMSR